MMHSNDKPSLEKALESFVQLENTHVIIRLNSFQNA